MSLYSKDALATLEAARAEIGEGYTELVVSFQAFVLHDHIAEEHLKHGFLRRIGYLARCIENVFSIIPPSFNGLPERDQLLDATINLHAFWINIFGAIDNLAWVWVRERHLVKSDGTELPDQWVGLKRGNKAVRKSFSPDFEKYLRGLDSWFEGLEGYRDGLAHRIPLYIPPCRILTADRPEYDNLSSQMNTVGSFAEYSELSNKRDALKAFSPLMTHSYAESARPLMFHAQMIADYRLMEELGKKMLDELLR